MKDFVIYSYQFAPLNDEPDLFIDIQKKNKELMDNKNKIFDSIIEPIEFRYRNKVYEKEVDIHKEDMIVMRLANKKNVKLEKDFHVIEQEDEPSCLTLIDNHEYIQRIAIEKNAHSFNNTDTIKNILLENFRNVLKDKELAFYMKKNICQVSFGQYARSIKAKLRKSYIHTNTLT